MKIAFAEFSIVDDLLSMESAAVPAAWCVVTEDDGDWTLRVFLRNDLQVDPITDGVLQSLRSQLAIRAQALSYENPATSPEDVVTAFRSDFGLSMYVSRLGCVEVPPEVPALFELAQVARFESPRAA